MNRSDVVKAVANQCNLTQKQVDQVLDLFVSTIKLSLECDEDVLISGFGKFTIRKRAAVRKINPRTRTEIYVPSKKTFIFTPSKVFKALITRTVSLEEKDN